MRPQDVLNNLVNYKGSYEYSAYKLQESEADVCIKALEEYINNHHAEIILGVKMQKGVL